MECSLSSSSRELPKRQSRYGGSAITNLRGTDDDSQKADENDPNGISTSAGGEEELNLYYKVLATHGSPDSFIKKMMDPKLGAYRHFAEGRKHLFLHALTVFEARKEWSSLYDLCLQALSTNDESGSPSLLGSDWRVWKSFITAAGKRPDPEASVPPGELETRKEKSESLTHTAQCFRRSPAHFTAIHPREVWRCSNVRQEHWLGAATYSFPHTIHDAIGP